MTSSTADLATQWRPHIEAWECSGLSQAAYCRKHGLVKCRFSYWKKKLSPVDADNERRSGFVPVRLAPTVTAELTLRLPNGVAVEGVCAKNLALARQLLRACL